MKNWNIPGSEAVFAVGQLAAWALLWGAVINEVLAPVEQALHTTLG